MVVSIAACCCDLAKPGGEGGGGELPIIAYMGRLHPKGVLQVYERIGI